MGLVFALIIAIALLLIKLNTERWDTILHNKAETRNSNKYTQSKIFSIAATSFFVNVYALILDSIALYMIVNEHVVINEHYVHALPYYVTAIDIVGALFWIGCWIASLISYCLKDISDNTEYPCSRCCKKLKKQEYMCLALSTLGPVISLLVHIPYIAIAYLNDASYATSMFIYYTVTVFVVFGTLDLTYGTCQGAIINAKFGDREERGCYHCCPEGETKRRRIFIVIIPLFTLLILVFAGMITAALVIIPISKAFSDVPNRLLGFYQTAIVLVGAYLIYLKFFKKKPTLDLVVKERKQFIPTDTIDSPEKWDQLSRDEKVEQFYTRFVDIIANYPINVLNGRGHQANQEGNEENRGGAPANGIQEDGEDEGNEENGGGAPANGIQEDGEDEGNEENGGGAPANGIQEDGEDGNGNRRNDGVSGGGGTVGEGDGANERGSGANKKAGEERGRITKITERANGGARGGVAISAGSENGRAVGANEKSGEKTPLLKK